MIVILGKQGGMIIGTNKANLYRYSITWRTVDDYGSLDFNITATSERQAIDKALKHLPQNCVAVSASRIN